VDREATCEGVQAKPQDDGVLTCWSAAGVSK